MQALEFTRSLQEIAKALKLRELLSLITPWLEPTNRPMGPPEKSQFTALLFESNSGYTRLAERPSTRRVMEAFSVNEFYEPSRLGGMLSAVTAFSQTSQIAGNIPTFKQFFTFAELIRWLLQVDSATKKLLQDEKVGTLSSSEAITQLELIEYADEQGISPKRITMFLSSVTELHTCVSLILGLKQDRLVVRYIDSGSGFLIGLKCAKEVAEAMDLLLSQWWDRIRFWRFDTFDKKVEAVAKTLALAEVVSQQVSKGVISEEEGQNLKRRALMQVETLTGIGASIPLTADATVNQQQLLAEMRNTKLLTAGDDPGEPQSVS